MSESDTPIWVRWGQHNTRDKSALEKIQALHSFFAAWSASAATDDYFQSPSHEFMRMAAELFKQPSLSATSFLQDRATLVHERERLKTIESSIFELQTAAKRGSSRSRQSASDGLDQAQQRREETAKTVVALEEKIAKARQTVSLDRSFAIAAAMTLGVDLPTAAKYAAMRDDAAYKGHKVSIETLAVSDGYNGNINTLKKEVSARREEIEAANSVNDLNRSFFAKIEINKQLLELRGEWLFASSYLAVALEEEKEGRACRIDCEQRRQIEAVVEKSEPTVYDAAVAAGFTESRAREIEEKGKAKAVA